MIDGYDSLLRKSGDLAGIFEYDGRTGFLYLYNDKKKDGNKIIGYIKVIEGKTDIEMSEISILWDINDEKVGLKIRGKLCAFFDCVEMKTYGGIYNEEKDDIFLRSKFGFFQ